MVISRFIRIDFLAYHTPDGLKKLIKLIQEIHIIPTKYNIPNKKENFPFILSSQ